MNETCLGFQINQEAAAGQQFLILSKPGFQRKELIEYQMEMVAQNTLPGIVWFELREKDREVKLIYHLKGLVNLEEFLQSQQVTPSVLLSLIERILAVLQESRNYLLAEQSFCLQAPYIFVAPKTALVALIYLPIDYEQDMLNSVRALVIDLVCNQANLIQAGDCKTKLLQLVHQEGFNLPEFLQEIKKLKIEWSNQFNQAASEVVQLFTRQGNDSQEVITIKAPQRPPLRNQQQPKILDKLSSWLTVK